jgi:hypothetical protein
LKENNETTPDLKVLSDEEDTKFTNWEELRHWIKDLETKKSSGRGRWIY